MPICCFVFPKSPILPMQRNDWLSMSDTCRMIYSLFKHNHPKSFSPEVVYDILKRRIQDEHFTLEIVWRCLDTWVMRRYIYRRNRLFWNLITERQLEAYENQNIA